MLTHGWPGSFVEFLEVIGPLTNPADPADAFHVVVPSLPGYGSSDRPTAAGWGVNRIAAAWDELMRLLGYERYGAQGGDWGMAVTDALGQRFPERVAGIHVTTAVLPADLTAYGALTPEELDAVAALQEHARSGRGYSVLQSTRPQTLGYGLTDSPAGQCAWIVEKLCAWTDCAGHPENALTRDQMLDNVSLYWFTATGTSSARLYWEGLGTLDRVSWTNAGASTKTGSTCPPACRFSPARCSARPAACSRRATPTFAGTTGFPRAATSAPGSSPTSSSTRSDRSFGSSANTDRRMKILARRLSDDVACRRQLEASSDASRCTSPSGAALHQMYVT